MFVDPKVKTMHPHNSAQGLPPAHGLYDPRFEHDACGVSFVADIHGRATHDIVARGLGALCNMEHRGATGAEADTGDGAGVLIQIPDRFLRAVVDFELPAHGAYAVGMAFLPGDPSRAAEAQTSIEAIMAEEGLTVLGWRSVPVDPSTLGKGARAVMPTFRQLFVSDPNGASGISRSQGLRGPQARGARPARGAAHLFPLAQQSHPHLQGHVHNAAAGGLLSRPGR